MRPRASHSHATAARAPDSRKPARARVVAMLLGCVLALPCAELGLCVSAWLRPAAREPAARGAADGGVVNDARGRGGVASGIAASGGATGDGATGGGATDGGATDGGATTRGAADGIELWCCGDSHTYGVLEEARDTYPSILEQHARAAGVAVRVRNFGVPGSNTQQVCATLERELELAPTPPRAVLVTAGVNNVWSWTSESSAELAEPPWYERLRCMRLARLVLARVRSRETAHETGRASAAADVELVRGADGALERVSGRDREGRPFELRTSHAPPPPSELDASIARDLARMAALARARDVELLVATYASDYGSLGDANSALRQACARLELPLLDFARCIEPCVERFGAARLFHRDLHLRASGYELFAGRWLRELVERGVVAAAPPERWGLELARAPDGAAALAWSGSFRTRDALVSVQCAWPGEAFQVLVSGDGAGAEAELGEMRLGLVDDALFRASLAEPALRGRLDEHGHARCELAPLFGPSPSAELDGLRLRAVLLVPSSLGRGHARVASSAAELVVR